MNTTMRDPRQARRDSPGDAPQSLHRVFDGRAVHALCNSVRRAIPGINAVDGLRAVRMLAAITGDPLKIPDRAREQARRDVLDRPSDGTMQAFQVPPDGWEARKHSAPNTQGLITRRGIARVIGECACDPFAVDPLPAGIRTRLYQALQGLERTKYGANAYQVDTITDLYFCGEIPRKIGTDAILAHQIGQASADVDTIGGDPVDLRGVTGHAHHKPQFPPRYNLPPVKARKSEHATARQLAAHADRPGYIWIGHRLIVRGDLARKPAGKRAAVKIVRTLTPVTATSADHVAQIAGALPIGKRRVITYKGTKLTVSRGKSNRVSITAGKGLSRSGLRTAQGIAGAANILTTA